MAKTPEVDPTELVTVPEIDVNDPAAVIAFARNATLDAAASVEVITGGGPGAVLPNVVFPRLGVERRVLAHVTDLVDETAFGPSNTLHAISRRVCSDPNTIRSKTAEHEHLDVEGRPLEEQLATVLDVLNRLTDAGLLERESLLGPYKVTEAGLTELGS